MGRCSQLSGLTQVFESRVGERDTDRQTDGEKPHTLCSLEALEGVMLP